MLDQFFITGELPATILKGHYIPWLVLVSYAVASLAAFTGLTLATRMYLTTDMRQKRRLHWAGAIALGSGIWSMHFLGMLAYDMNMEHAYNPWITGFSGLIAVAVAWFVFTITQASTLSLNRLAAGAIVLGLGVATMHYTGMEAMEMKAQLRYTPGLFFLSVAIAIAASGAALWIIFTLGRSVSRRQSTWRILAALVMGIAVCGMHYTGMAAAVITPFADCRFGVEQSFSALEIGILAVTGLICIISLMLGVANRLAVLALCGAVFSLPLVTIVYHALSSLNEDIVFAEKEQQGARYHEELVDLLINLQTLRGMANIEQNGGEIDAIVLRSQQQAVRDHIASVSAIDSDVGLPLGVHHDWELLYPQFQDLLDAHNEHHHADAEYEFAKHTAIIRSLMNFMEEVIDHSNLKADPQLDNNFLADTSLYLIPEIMETVGQLRGLGAGYLASGNYPPSKWPASELRRLQALNDKADTFNTAMKNNLARAQTINSAVGKFAEQYNETIEPYYIHFQQFFAAMVFDKKIPWTSKELFTEGADVIRRYDDLYDAAAKNFYQNLEQRQHVYALKSNLVLGASLIAFLGFSALFLFLFRSLTKTERAERDARHARRTAEQAAAAKSDFLANMSHELRTPMNGVLGMAQLLADTELTEEQRQYVSTINGSGENLLMLLNDILDFSKIEAGALTLEHIAYPIKEAFTGTMNLLQPQAVKKGIELQVECEPEVPDYIWGDSGRIRQVITNLVGNAIKFTESGHVRLTARLQEREAGNYLHISVEDTGMGIAADKLEKIFDKFTQADASVTRKFGGTGLGLAITKQLVALMDGQIGVESVEGKGSTFWFVIPCKLAQLSDLITKDSREVLRQTNLAKKPAAQARVLLVEDYPVNQVFAQKLLKKFGFEQIDLAEDGSVALQKFHENTYDIIFMDCQMPKLDGYVTTQEIRMLESATLIHTPIVAMTANAMMGDREKCLKSGMDDYLSKPLRAAHLKKVLETWFRLDANKADIVKPSAAEPRMIEQVPVDMEQLRMFTDGDPEEERAIVTLFLDQAQSMIDILHKNIDLQGNETWKSAAHRFKGASGNFGAMKLHHLCKRAETHFEDIEPKKLEMLAAIKAETTRVEKFFQAS